MSLSPLARATIKNQAIEAQIEQARREVYKPIAPSLINATDEFLTNTPLPPNEWFWEETIMVKDRVENGIVIWRTATPFEKAQMQGKKA